LIPSPGHDSKLPIALTERVFMVIHEKGTKLVQTFQVFSYQTQRYIMVKFFVFVVFTFGMYILLNQVVPAWFIQGWHLGAERGGFMLSYAMACMIGSAVLFFRYIKG
jgi:hypothetical protein